LMMVAGHEIEKVQIIDFLAMGILKFRRSLKSPLLKLFL